MDEEAFRAGAKVVIESGPEIGQPSPALALIAAEEVAYARLIRGLCDPGCDADPESLCARVLDALDAAAAGSWEELMADAEAAGRPSRLLSVLAALATARLGEWERSFAFAKTALAADQRDTYAQRLYLAAAGTLGLLTTPSEDDLRGRFCALPFEQIDIQAQGRIHTCCPTWLPVPIGSLRDGDAGAVWNSAAAQAIRRSVLDGSFRFCSRMHCPMIANGLLPRRDEVRDPYHRAIIDRQITHLDRGPKRLTLAYDASCNLSCPSCRTQPIMARKDERDRLDRFAELVVLPLLRDAELVHVTGSGDPFASGHFRSLLKRLNAADFPGLKIQLQTNGVLLDRDAWRELGLDGLVDSLWVSIDAATPATYAVLRRGGDWVRLLHNLMFMRELRREGQLRIFRLDFVVQARNFRELPAVVELARVFGCDRLRLQMIRNWGTFTPAEFKEHFIGAPDHPAFEEFLEILRHPNLADPIVDLSTVRPMFELARVASRGVA